MQRRTLFTVLTLGLIALLTLGRAQAHDHVSISVSTPEFGIRVGPPPVRYYHPAPVIYQPAPTVIYPAPVYHAPRGHWKRHHRQHHVHHHHYHHHKSHHRRHGNHEYRGHYRSEHRGQPHGPRGGLWAGDRWEGS